MEYFKFLHLLINIFTDNVNRLYEAVTTLVQKVEEVNKRLMIIESTIVDSHKSIDVNLIEMMLPFQKNCRCGRFRNFFDRKTRKI